MRKKNPLRSDYTNCTSPREFAKAALNECGAGALAREKPTVFLGTLIKFKLSSRPERNRRVYGDSA